jgi:glycogen(starch) synthase
LKGFDLLVDIAGATLDLPVTFEIFGLADTGEESEYIRTARDRARATGADRRIHLRGRTDSPGEVYKDLDLVLITSTRESFCRVAAEALLAGVPVVAPDIPGLRETVDGGRLAWLFPPGEAEGASGAIRRVLQDPSAAQETAREGQRFAERFSPAAAAGQVLQVYRALGVPQSSP